MSHPTYEIATLNDMLEIPTDRLDAFLLDLKAYLLSVQAARLGASKLAPIIHPDLTLEIKGQGMTWIDDGVNAIRGIHADIAGNSSSYYPNPNFPQPE